MRLLSLLLLAQHAVAIFPEWFLAYTKKHQKNYDAQAERVSFAILQAKYDFIQQHTGSLELSLNANSDQNKYGRSLKMRHRTRRHARRLNSRFMLPHPQQVDWRPSHVTGVVDQGQCGGCFAFAAIGHLEFWHRQKTGRLIKLSIQQALDCSWPQSEGCEGGLMEDVFLHAMHNPIGTETNDRWSGHDKHCVHGPRPHVQVNHYVSFDVDDGDNIEALLPSLIANYGPVPVAIHSTSRQFDLYRSGIVKREHCQGEVDHAVLVVGYTDDYWIVKNSWGTSWGQNGYVYIERGHNACDINTYASLATSVTV